MKCPCCSQDTKALVKETRSIEGKLARKRECSACGETFATVENHDPTFVFSKAKPDSKYPKLRHRDNNDLFKVWNKA